MRDYWVQRRERRPIVYILFKQGLSTRQIGEIMGCSPAIVNIDIRDHGGTKSFTNRPENSNQTFVAIIKLLADLYFKEEKWSQELGQEMYAKLKKFILSLPDISNLRIFLEGICLDRMWLENIRTTLPNCYAELLKEMGDARFNTQTLSQPTAAVDNANMLANQYFENFLGEIHIGKTPENYYQARWRIFEIVMERAKIDDILVQFDPEKAIEIIEIALKSLDPRKEQILRMHYGIGIDRSYTLGEIGREFGVIGERIRQLEVKALWDLRSTWQDNISSCNCFTNIGNLNDLIQQLQTNLSTKKIELQQEIERLSRLNEELRSSLSKSNPVEFQILDQRIDYLPFSKRITNRMPRLKIEYIGQLVQTTEEELLRIDNLGEKSIKEIIVVLVSQTPPLHLGMDIGKWTPPED